MIKSDVTKHLGKILLILGALVRIIPYLYNRSLWYDEANLSSGIVNLNFSELSEGLPYEQAAPLFFLYVEKTMTVLFGNNEYALRLFPLIVSLVGLFLFKKIVDNILPRPLHLLALAFFAFNSTLVYYASEVKQYSVDVFANLLLVWMFLEWRKSNTFGNYLFFGIAIIGTLLIWFSQPIIFLLAPIGLAFFIISLKGKMQWTWLFIPAILWLISFAIFFWWQLIPTINNEAITYYHAKYLMPYTFWKEESWQWYWANSLRLIKSPGGFFFSSLALPFIIVGNWWMIKKTDTITWIIIILPGLLGIFLSIFGLYTTIDRLMLYSSPAIIIACSFGLAYLHQQLQQYKWIAIILGGVLLLQSFLNTAIHNIGSFEREEFRSVLEIIEKKRQPGDELYAYAFTDAGLRYYLPKYPNCTPSIYGKPLYENWQEDFSQLKSGQRMWLMFTHANTYERDEEKIISHLELSGKIVEKETFMRSSYYLYQKN